MHAGEGQRQRRRDEAARLGPSHPKRQPSLQTWCSACFSRGEVEQLIWDHLFPHACVYCGEADDACFSSTICGMK